MIGSVSVSTPYIPTDRQNIVSTSTLEMVTNSHFFQSELPVIFWTGQQQGFEHRLFDC